MCPHGIHIHLYTKGEGGGGEEAGIFHTAVKTINITGERLWIKAGVTLALGSRVCVGVVCLVMSRAAAGGRGPPSVPWRSL